MSDGEDDCNTRCAICLCGAADGDDGGDGDDGEALGPLTRRLMDDQVGVQWLHGTCWQIWQTERTKRAQNLNTGYFDTDYSDPAAAIADPAAHLPYGKGLRMDICTNRSCPVKFIQRSEGCSEVKCLCGSVMRYTGVSCATPQRTLNLVIAGLGWDAPIAGTVDKNRLLAVAIRNGNLGATKQLVSKGAEVPDGALTFHYSNTPRHALASDNLAACVAEYTAVSDTKMSHRIYSAIFNNYYGFNPVVCTNRFVKFILNDPRLVHRAFQYRDKIWNFSAKTTTLLFTTLLRQKFIAPTESCIMHLTDVSFDTMCRYAGEKQAPIPVASLVYSLLKRIRESAGPKEDAVGPTPYHISLAKRICALPGYFAAILDAAGRHAAGRHATTITHCVALAKLSPGLYARFAEHAAMAETARNPRVAKCIIYYIAPEPAPSSTAAAKRTHSEMDA